MTRVGIVQGRLSPPATGAIQSFPHETWREEFLLAQDLGLSHIEWVLDIASAHENPLLSRTGRDEISEIVRQSGVPVLSVCADYFRDRPLIRVGQAALEERFVMLRRLVGACEVLGIRHMMIPFVEDAAIHDNADLDQAIAVLNDAAALGAPRGVAIAIESSLPPQAYAEFIRRLDPRVRITYDMGDCAAANHDPTEEIQLLGPRLECVHVKDRLRGGASVPLGTGDTDFERVFDALGSIGYAGPFTLQTARGVTTEETQTTKNSLRFVCRYLARTPTTS